jgi:hypothetical protein
MKGIPQIPHLRCAVNEAQLIPKLRHEGVQHIQYSTPYILQYTELDHQS